MKKYHGKKIKKIIHVDEASFRITFEDQEDLFVVAVDECISIKSKDQLDSFELRYYELISKEDEKSRIEKDKDKDKRKNRMKELIEEFKSEDLIAWDTKALEQQLLDKKTIDSIFDLFERDIISIEEREKMFQNEKSVREALSIIRIRNNKLLELKELIKEHGV